MLVTADVITTKRLFTISKNRNNNIVVYDIKVNNNGQIIDKNPVKVYWLIYKQNKFVYKKINNLEEKAYGIKVLNENNNFILILKAVPSKPINIRYTADGPKAETYINGKKAYLSNIYVFTTNNIIPKVIYYIVTGFDVNTGNKTEEKVFL
jgi:hypothetical protein